MVLRADTSEQMWAGVLDARAALPDTAVVVLCPQEDAFTPPGAGMRGCGLRYAGHTGASGAGQLKVRNNAPRSSGVKQRRARCIKKTKRKKKKYPGKSRQPKSRMHLQSKVQATRRMPPRAVLYGEQGRKRCPQAAWRRSPAFFDRRKNKRRRAWRRNRNGRPFPGTVENIVYCNEENGYTVLEFSSGETFIPRWASFRM